MLAVAVIIGINTSYYLNVGDSAASALRYSLMISKNVDDSIMR